MIFYSGAEFTAYCDDPVQARTLTPQISQPFRTRKHFRASELRIDFWKAQLRFFEALLKTGIDVRGLHEMRPDSRRHGIIAVVGRGRPAGLKPRPDLLTSRRPSRTSS